MRWLHDRDSADPAGFEAAASFRRGLGIGLALGTGIGVSMGFALDNLALGIGIGVAIGLTFALAFGAAKKPPTEERPSGAPATEDPPPRA
ncbi:hypothetical protein JOE59_000112 [Agromyces cerinus]|uniref:hypothetical protein n=1 Tax=Agromyces cerinus TaxID=33878 RepID=UPI001958DD1B|nr:hypothetical protein [Agromyces cerinus]MBM7829407.1 hypothetical protein [Agromyces cerinus]